MRAHKTHTRERTRVTDKSFQLVIGFSVRAHTHWSEFRPILMHTFIDIYMFYVGVAVAAAAAALMMCTLFTRERARPRIYECHHNTLNTLKC